MSDSLTVDESAAMVDCRLTASTKRTYKSAQNALKKYIKAHPDYKSQYDAEHDKLRLPLSDAAVKGFLGTSLRKRDGTLKTNSTVSSMISAIQALYVDDDKIFNDNALLRQHLKKVVSGHKKTVAQLKSTGEMKQDEGKRHLKVKGYRMLCRLALEQGEDAVHLYLVSQWNLMVRTINVKMLNYIFFAIDGDASTIKTPYQKGDQEGKNAYPKHVYANSKDPMSCQFFAMGIHVVCNAFQQGSDTRVFQVACMESTFSNWLKKVVRGLTAEELLELGMEAEDIGTHSIRKGAGTYCSSQPSGPNPQSIRLRMDHSIGNVESRYIFEGEGTDQMLGRVVAGLDFNTLDFAALPPHFADMKVLTPSEWALTVPGYNHYPKGFQECIPYYIAALAANHEFAAKLLPPWHRLFNSPFWTNGFHLKLHPLVLHGVGTCAITGMRATGLPPHHLLSVHMNEMQIKAGEFESSVHEKLDDLMAKLPTIIADEIRSKIEVNGAVAVTNDDVKKMLSDFNDTLFKRLDQHREDASATAPTSSASSAPPLSFQTFHWAKDGKFHHVREGFRLPRDCVKAVFNLWHCGNLVERIVPYKSLIPGDMIDDADEVALSKLRHVMEKIETIAVEKEFVVTWPNVKAMEPVERDELFRKCYEELYKGNSSKRIGELSYLTVCKHIYEKKCSC